MLNAAFALSGAFPLSRRWPLAGVGKPFAQNRAG